MGRRAEVREAPAHGHRHRALPRRLGEGERALSDDPLGAFCPGERVRLDGAPDGPLAGLTFAAKDLFDVAGHVTGAGNPDWAATHGPASETAPVITRLVDAGASLVGKTVMDELASGAFGVNAHYGTPRNPLHPDRIPGGSSSGSASAVAGHAVDFALGSDSACSVRLPAAACGILGMRPTLGRVSTRGMVPLSPCLDTVGWFARDAALLERVGHALLDGPADDTPLRRWCVADDALELVTPEIAEAVLREVPETVERVRVSEGTEGLPFFWYRVRSMQVRETWQIHGEWIERTKPDSRVLSRESLADGADRTAEQDAEARAHWDQLAARVRACVSSGTVLVVPTLAGLPPRLDQLDDTLAFIRPTLCLMSIAGVAGLPQLAFRGFSLVGAAGSDEALLELATRRDL